MRRASRKDANQAAIVEALRAVGVVVRVVNQEGLPDLLTYWHGVWLPIEVKQPGERLTPAQEQFRTEALFPVVETVDDALRLFVDQPCVFCGRATRDACGECRQTMCDLCQTLEAPFRPPADGCGHKIIAGRRMAPV